MYRTAALAVGGALLLLYIASSIITNRRHAKQAADWGCQLPKRRQHYWPLGFDLVQQLIKADQAQLLPPELEKVQKSMGVDTWIQYVVSSDLIVTDDPQNIKAVLATQFNDFEIGPQRRGSFFPLLGNGIFTSDGKVW
jgi:hypothetical protein